MTYTSLHSDHFALFWPMQQLLLFQFTMSENAVDILKDGEGNGCLHPVNVLHSTATFTACQNSADETGSLII
jgi:hypothetical protein